MSFQPKNLMGWKSWRYLNTHINSVNLPSAQFPRTYLPSRGFILDAPILHCQLYPPWSSWLSPFETFTMGGGLPTTIIGATEGLAAVASSLNERTTETWAIGYSPPLQFGYNIGDLYKEHVYVYLKVFRPQGGLLAPSYSADVVQRSRFKRIYIKHGEIASYKKSGQDKVISIGIEGSFPTGLKIPDTAIKIFKANGEELSYKISSIKSNWDIVLGGGSSDSKEVEPAPGDFFTIDQSWAIEDPLLMSGFWMGQESENVSSSKTVSPDNVYVTSHNIPYESGIFFTGAYVWKKMIAASNATSSTTSSQISSTSNSDTTTTTTTTTAAIEPAGKAIPSAGTSMDDANGYEWVWIPFANNVAGVEVFDYVYGNTTRYKLAEEVVDTNTGAIGHITKTRTIGTMQDLKDLLAAKPSYVRLEISKGGNNFRNNWQPPCLKFSYIKKDEKYYKILAQPESYTVDVSTTAAYGYIKPTEATTETEMEETTTTTTTVQELQLLLDGDFEIFNQYSWMITEHFQSNSNYGMFGGNCNGEGNVSINVLQESNGTTNVNSSRKFAYLKTNSFYERFKTDYDGGDKPAPKKMWQKFNKWRVVKNAVQYLIDYTKPVTIGQNSSYPYKVDVTLVDGTTTFDNEMVYIAFDEIFQTVSGTSFRGVFDLSVKEGIDSGQHPVLCLDGDWYSAPIKIEIPYNTQVGVCEGYMFGLGALINQVPSRIGATILIAVPNISGGLSSFFHSIREEDCVFYRDIKSNKLTIRKGTLDFREMPRKQEVSIGKIAAEEETTETNPIKFNGAYDRVKMVQMDVPDSTTSGGTILFTIGNKNDYYGFYISGEGDIDFQALRKGGYSPGEIKVDHYKNGTYFVSPVYLYKSADLVNKLKSQILDIGVKPSEGPLYVVGGEVSSVKISYVNEKQTMENIGLYDATRLGDGEMVIIYGCQVGEFNADNQPNNGGQTSTQWKNPNCIFIIGSSDDGFSWNCPIIDKNKIDQNKLDYQYGIMLLNCVDYFSSIYDERNNKIRLLVRGYTQDGSSFLGLYTINISTLADNLVFCSLGDVNSAITNMPFLYRPQTIPYLKDKDATFVDERYLVNVASTVSTDFITPTIKDSFVRIAGPVQTKSQISYNADFSLPSLFVLSDGSLIVLFDGIEGIRMFFSNNYGTTWSFSNAILARDANVPVLIGDYLVFITASGVEAKKIGEDTLFTAMEMILGKAGVSATDIEREQQKIDAIPATAIGSGPVDIQRVSGYKTKQGTTKIFYYNSEGLMCCIEEDNKTKWHVANNF